MIRWILAWVGGLAWSGLVFVAALWWTFPSEAVVQRAQVTVSQMTAGTYALEATSAAPWWAGLTLHEATLLTVQDGKATPAFEADAIGVRTSIFGALGWAAAGGDLPIVASVRLGDSTVDATLDLGSDLRPKRLSLDGPGLTVKGLGALAASYGYGFTGDGTVDLHADLQVGASLKELDGKLRLEGKGLTVTPEAFAVTLNVSSLDVAVDFRDGIGTIQKGLLRSDQATVELEGDLTLADQLMKSRLKSTLVLGELSGTVATFEGFMAQAKWDDEKYHYRLSCTLERLGASCFRPDRQRGARSSANRPARDADLGDNVTSAALPPPAILDGPASAAPPGPAAAADAERLREERRRQREERLAERRRRIEEARENGDAPIRPDEFDPDEDFRPDMAIPDNMLQPPDLDLRPGMMPGSALGAPQAPDELDEQ